jgi:hypothetical protein
LDSIPDSIDSDDDNDGVGDNSDQCPDTSLNMVVDTEGCEISTKITSDSAYSSITSDYGIMVGVGISFILVVIIIIVIRNRDYGSGDDEEENQQEFPEENLIGQRAEDGYEWLEHPAHSGTWYWRDQQTGEWIQH